ncbi:MAG: VCBS repeat-containing protein [Kofleriaceae bacterium]
MRITPLLLLLSACAMDVADEVDTDTQDLTTFHHEFSATTPNPRLEIGRWGGCTATLIRPNWALLSAQCWRYIDGRNLPGVASTFDAFQVLPDGRTASQTLTTDRTFSFTQGAGQAGQNDLMLAHLTSNAVGVTPAPIATTTPTTGAAVQWGIGCRLADGTGFGILRAFMTSAGVATPVACSGDQGGPKTLGAFTFSSSVHDPIFQVQSSFSNVYGNPVLWKAAIDGLINEWDVNGWADIYKSGWCTGAGDRKFEIDLNADGQADALCWNSATGQERVAQGVQRLIRPVAFATSATFCSGASKEMLVGDFDADGKTDLLCHDKTNGANQIDLGRNGYAGTDIFEAVTGWCSHSTGQLHVGDFDGDGASDLLCHDTATGHTWVDMNPHGFATFDGVSEIDLNTTFCSHAGAKLLIGDVDGNGLSDLICHTPSTGQIHVDRTYPSDKFGGVDFTLEPSGTNHFCTSGRVEVGDYDGDRRSDLKCVTATGTWPSLYASSTGTFSYDNEFGYGGDAAQRTVKLSARPWSYER